MQRVSFNEGWSVRPKISAFLECRGGRMPSWTPVLLPHDVMIGSDRRASEGPGMGYFPGGTWEYQKKFVVPEEHRGKRTSMEFEGVYRDALVSVNGSFAGHHPYGYTGFAWRSIIWSVTARKMKSSWRSRHRRMLAGTRVLELLEM